MEPGKSPRLVMRKDGDEVVLPLLLRETLIGRIDSNHVVLDDASVSRIHARVLVEPEKVWVEDCGSTVGTLVNGDPIDRHQLAEGDVLSIGEVKLVYREA